MAKTVVILGAGWAGLPLAHKLLKYTLPKVKDLKIVLVSPNSRFYWNVAATRGVVPGAIPDDQLFLPIEAGFAQQQPANFEFVLGKATQLDLERNTVELMLNDGTTRSQVYDEVVVATGSRIKSDLPLKLTGSDEETLAALHALQKQIEAAETIVVGGGGPTGVETAGEIAAAYGGKKQITLVVGGEHTLPSSGALPAVSKTVEQDLGKLGVKLVYGSRVESATASTTGQTSPQTTLTLSDGSTLVTDLYLPLFGVQLNTEFIPKTFLDDTGSIVLEKTMRIRGAAHAWAIGDAGNLEAKQLTVTDAQIIHLAGSLDTVLTSGTDAAITKEYVPSPKTMVFVALGKKYATGQIGSWKLWGWMVAYVKGRNLFVDTAQDYVGGKKLRHASM